jgi:serine protease Do
MAQIKKSGIFALAFKPCPQRPLRSAAASLRRSRRGPDAPQSFAVPSSVAKPVIDQLKAHGTVERGWLGVQIQRLTPEIAKSLGRDEPQGALVAAVTADSPAAKAGVRQGDIVLAFAGKKIAEPRDLSLAVATAPIGKEASLTVWRDGKELELHSMIGLMPKSVETARGEEPSEEPSAHKHSALGLRFAPLTDEARQELAW